MNPFDIFIIVLIVLSALAGVITLAIRAWPPWKSARHAAAAVALALAAILVLRLVDGVPPLPGALVALGRSLAFRLGVRNPQTGERYQPNILYVGEGMNESVAVSGNGRVRLFHVSGKIEASTSPKDMRLQRMLAEVPALIHPRPRSVLIVGFGAGVTAGSFVPYPSIERIVVCELEPLVPQRVSQYFREENFDVVSDPRVQIVYDDARHYMLTSRERFDVITSDPIHPWVRGSAALYSQDYFEMVRRHLNPGGVVSQWVPLYQSSDSTIRGELATFFSVFPTGTIWANNERGQGYDLVLVGTNGPATIDLGQVEARLRSPDYARVLGSLEGVGFKSSLELFSAYAGRNADLGSWLAGAEINRDRRLWLQYRAGLESYTEQEVDIYAQVARFRRFPDDLFVGSDSLKRAFMGSAGQPPRTP